MKWLLVFLGGGAGSLCRFGIGLLLANKLSIFPWATLVANVAASVFIAILWLSGVKAQQANLWMLLATGFCGGLSTFSAFSLETFQLFRQGNHLTALGNLILSVVICLGVFFLLSKWIQHSEAS